MSNATFKEIRAVYNKLGKQYIQDAVHLDPTERKPFRAEFPKGARILDVGCAGGRDSAFFARGGLDVTGIDASDVFVREARKAVPKGTFVQGDLLEMSFPKDSFDGIWAQAVLLHLKRKDVPRALKKFYKVLKPGGLLHIRVKKGKGEEYVREELSGWNERFYTYFSKTEMERMLRSQGFKIVYSGIFPDQLKRKNITWLAFWACK